MVVKRCFLDMDGVIADFVNGVCNAHCRNNPYSNSSARGTFEIEKLWGMSVEEFWAPTETERFWDTLNKTPEADEIVAIVEEHFGQENVAVLTAPSMSPYCVPGKRRWIRRGYKQFSDKIIFACRETKAFMATPDTWLIDDRDENIDGFIRCGGNGILLPRLWNRRHAESAFVVQRLKEELR